MKAKLTYNLPDERDDFENAINGWKYSCAVSDFDFNLRSKQKHQGIETIDISEVRSLLREFLGKYNLRIEE